MNILQCFLDNRYGGPQKRGQIVADELTRFSIYTFFLCNEKLKKNNPFRSHRCYLLPHLQVFERHNTFINCVLFVLFFVINVFRIGKIIRTEKIGIIHCNGLLNIIPAVAGRLYGCKVVWHLNDALMPSVLKTIFVPLVNALADAIVATSEAVKNFYYVPCDCRYDKITILPVPVDFEKYNPTAVSVDVKMRLRNELGIPEHACIIGTVGNINKIKGYEYFIHAAASIKKQKYNCTYLIVGAVLNTKIQYAQELIALGSRLGLDNDIIYTGFRENIPALLAIMDVFVLSSLSESGPMVVLEAMAMNIPVVATAVGAVPQQLSDGVTGCVVPPANIEKLVQGIVRMLHLSDVDRSRLVERARMYAHEQFSLPIVVNKHSELYNRVWST